MNPDGGAWTEVVTRGKKNKTRKTAEASSASVPPNAHHHGIHRSTAANGHHKGRHQQSGIILSVYFSKERFIELIKASVPEVTKVILSQIKLFQRAIESSDTCRKDISLVLQVLLQVSKGLSVEGETMSNSIIILNEIFSSRCYNFQAQLKQFISLMPASDSFKESDLNVVCDLFHNLLEKMRGNYWTTLPLETLFETVNFLCQHKRLRNKEQIKSKCNQLDEFYSEMKKIKMVANIKKYEPDKEDYQWDNSDYRDIPIIPQWHEIAQAGPPSRLRPNIVFGEYEDWMHYYDVQFRLLREDFIAPLRKGIAEYRANKLERNSNVRVYTDVYIGSHHFTRTGLCHTIRFDVRRFPRINWEYSKRLIFGSLLCFSPASDNFQHSAKFAVIVERSAKELANGRIKVMFSEGSEVLVHKQDSTRFVMVESVAFYEASSHVLRSLQLADDTTMPFTQYLIKNSKTVGSPRYLKMASKDVVYDLRFIIKKEVVRKPKWARKYSEVKILNKMAWPPQEETILDESQLKAMKMALTQEVVVIQGPPGTGKTYMGLKIVQALLENQDFWSPKETRREPVRNGPPKISEVRTGGPILIMCFTNHALDQFLEGILDLYKDKNSEAKPTLIRVGSRSKSDTLKSYNLNEVMKTQDVPYQYRKECRELMDRRDGLIKDCQLELLKYSNPVYEFVEFSDIKEFISDHHIRSLKDNLCTSEERDQALYIWLGLYITEEHEVPQETEANDLSSEEEYQPSVESSDDESEYSFARSTFDDSDTDSSKELSDFKEEQQERMLEGMKDMYMDILTDSGKPIQTKKKLKIKHKIKRVVKVVECKNYKRFLKNKTRGLNTISRYNELEAEEIEDVNQLQLDDRWELYKFWYYKFRGKLGSLEGIFQEYHHACEDANRAWQNKERFALENAQIVGMTTTGTAKYQHILHMVKPKIVVVEEAAEVMESHIVSALNAGTQQLILIGDHKQLRPKPNDYDMVKEYKLDISLFERLVKKEFPYATLENQHRMRPEIAELVHPHIYQTLHNHESVLKYRKIDRIGKNLYFICHNEPEHVSSDQSHANEYEASYLIALCEFILQNCNYKPTEITILVTYTGQLLLMRNKMLSSPIIKGVRICTVDNFQGEENDIILLSLVRSNDNSSIGFLKEENRVCVSLSRARHAFYCIGNFKMLQRSKPPNIWHTIIPFMEEKGNLGYGLEIQCKNHPQQKYQIHLPKEFEQKSPRGGCTLPCNYRLRCGHTCPHMCHLNDPDHLHVRCRKPCPKKCELGHDCKLMCSEMCRCTELVEKEFPKCKHKRLVKCFKDISELKCNKKVEKEIPGCGHIQEIACHKDPSIFKCLEKVVKVLPLCRHEQTVTCSENVYSVKCTELVMKALPICNHSQYVMCHMNTLLVTCESYCDRMCQRNLHKCGKKCHGNSRCLPCREKVEEVLNCGHRQAITCSSNPESEKCMNDCEQECSRGHKCKQRCYEQCRRCMVEIEVQSEKCGHVNMVNCFEVERFVCTIPVPKKLKCGHVRTLPCPDDPDGVKCSVMISLTLLKCRHTLKINCWEELSQVKCQELIPKKLICGHTQDEKCYLKADEIVCWKKSTRELECGHKRLLECCADLKTIKCDKMCQKSLDCGHVVTVLCYEQPTKDDCVKPCTVTLPCNHSVTVPCNQVSRKYNCTQLCEKKLWCGHQCRNWCMEECFCSEIVSQALPCGHTAEVRCQDNITSYKCMESCKKILSCGHKCKSLCHEPCDTMCKARVSVVCDQGHKRTSECSQQRDSRCTEKCTRLLPCKHQCKKLCYEQCTVTCRSLVKKKYPCGHVHRIPCSSPMEKHPCDYICRYPLSCGHPCNGECSKCFSTRIHEPCTSSVGLRHFCGEKVRLKCLGLKGKHPKSTVREYLGKNIVCKHKEVPWKCSSSFDKCSNHCDWSCPSQCPKPKHCTRLCSELCDRPPCDEPCSLKMKCGQHRCIGLCGERCISVCPTCEPRPFKSHLKKASEYFETEKYVELQCGHIFTVAFMDNYVFNREGERKVLLLCCPVCFQPMSCSYRYGNAMKESLQDIKEVNKLMEKKSKGNRESLIELYCEGLRELKISQVMTLCPPQLFDIVGSSMKKMSERKILKVEDELLLFLVIKIYHLVKRLKLSESAAAILDNLLQWLRQYWDDLELSFQVIYDLLSEYYRLCLVVMTAASTLGPATVLKQVDRINSNPHSRISTKDFNDWSKQLDVRRSADVQHNLDRFLPRIKNGIWMKCRSGHYYCIPVTQPDVQIHRVQCFECIGSYSASISIEMSDDVRQTLQKSVDISEQREKAIRDEIRREQEEAAQGGGTSDFREGKANSRKRRRKKNRN